jgi:hypothetical protein
MKVYGMCLGDYGGLWNSLGVGSVGLRVGWTVEWSEDLGIWKVGVEGFRRGWLRIYGDRPGEL